MVWLSFFLLALIAAIPAVVTFARAGSMRGRREAALTLHRAQLAELDREQAEGRIGAPEHAAALLEVERRLLREGAHSEPVVAKRIGWGIFAAILVVVPLVALGLYLPAGDPGLPAAPLGPRLVQAHAEQAAVTKLVAILKGRLATLDPKSKQAHEGFLLLGRVEAGRGNFAAAAAAWRKALDDQFDPALAAATAEVETRAAGRVDREALALFKKALAAAPANAPWRKLVEQRLAEASRE